MSESPSNALVPVEPEAVELGIVRASNPKELVARATEAADALAAVIESRKLYSNIQGKKFVRCEGWTTLAAMLGVTPHEIGVTEAEGAFTATVELRRLTDGQPVSRASAECGPDEPTWAKRARNARRSMALTRATAKACRMAFSWIMALSGYEVTPAEEMAADKEEAGGAHPQAVAGTKAPASAAPPAGVSDDGEVIGPTRDTKWPGPGPTHDLPVREWSSAYLRMADDGSVKVPDEWLSVVRQELKARSFKKQLAK